MPISYGDLLILHDNCFRVLALPATATNNLEPAKNSELDTALYQRYCKFQVAYKSRLKHLNEGSMQFEKPAVDSGDKCMPRLLIKYSLKNKSGSQQPAGNYEPGKSCAFDSARITAYEKANASFKEEMLKPAKESIPQLRDLIFMDIAYLHLRNVKWARRTAAHLDGGNGADDDDAPRESEAPPVLLRDDYRFTEWDVTDLSAVPWEQLHFSLSGSKVLKDNDLPQYLLPALCLAAHAIYSSKSCGTKVPEALSAFYDRCSAAIESSAGIQVETFLDIECKDADPPTSSWKADFKARDYTPDETKYVATVWQLAAEAFWTRSVAEPAGGGGPGGAEKGHDDTSGQEREQQDESAAARDEGRSLRRREGGSAITAASKVPANAGRQKAMAKFRAGATKDVEATRDVRVEVSHGPRVTSDTRRAGKGGRKRSAEEREAKLPLSSRTNRVLHGQVHLNKQFPKSYISDLAPKKSPVPNLTLGRAWHVVSACSRLKLYLVLIQSAE